LNIGYCDGRQSEKRWICDKEDLEAMYSSPARRDDREAQIDDLVDELREMHSEKHDYTEPHYRL